MLNIVLLSSRESVSDYHKYPSSLLAFDCAASAFRLCDVYSTGCAEFPASMVIVAVSCTDTMIHI